MKQSARCLGIVALCALAFGAEMKDAWADAVPAQQKPSKQAQKPLSKKEQEARKRDAKQKFSEGREAMNRGEYTSALVLFRTSQELYPSPGTLLNLALCEERLGLLGTAYLHLQEVQKLLPADDERASIANTGALSLEPRVPKLHIELAPGSPPDTSVSLGPRILSAEELSKDHYLDPGKVVVVVSASGRPDRVYEPVLIEGKRSTLSVEPGELPKAEIKPPETGAFPGALPPSGLGNGQVTQGPTAAPRPDIIILPPDPRLRTAAYIAGGVGLLGLGVGGVGGIIALLKKNEVDTICTDPTYCSNEGLEAERAGKTAAMASTIGFSIGLVGAAAGITLWVLGAGGRAETKNTSLFIKPGVGGMGLGARF